MSAPSARHHLGCDPSKSFAAGCTGKASSVHYADFFSGSVSAALMFEMISLIADGLRIRRPVSLRKSRFIPYESITALQKK